MTNREKYQGAMYCKPDHKGRKPIIATKEVEELLHICEKCILKAIKKD